MEGRRRRKRKKDVELGEGIEMLVGWELRNNYLPSVFFCIVHSENIGGDCVCSLFYLSGVFGVLEWEVLFRRVVNVVLEELDNRTGVELKSEPEKRYATSIGDP